VAEGWDAAVAAALAERPVVAIVGARRATASGGAFARALAEALARRGAVVVSGLARGIDAAAHEGALAAGGITVAVLGCGTGCGYPRANRDLRRRILGSGAVVSEYWPDTPPAPWRFPARNRIVAGLAHAVVVVEAAGRSGALITADFALEQGRPVLAVPNAPWVEAAAGCNELLRAGAAVCTCAEDVVAECPDLPWLGEAVGAARTLEGLPAGVLAAVREAPRRLDELTSALGADPGPVSAALGLLEMEGLVTRGDGQRWLAVGA
jgi:DNA processing protein